MIEIQNLTKTFGRQTPAPILKDVSTRFTQGQSYAITGPSGSGKSTLLQMLGALDFPTEGELFLQGIPYSQWDLNKLRRDYFGFVFQNYFLFEDLSVLDNVLMPAKIAGIDTSPRSEAYQRALMLIDYVDLTPHIQKSAYTLSGGEKQRVSIARALMNDPPVILADEPTGNIDRTHSHVIQDLLLDTCQSGEKMLILVTHDLDFASRLDLRYEIENHTLKALTSV